MYRQVGVPKFNNGIIEKGLIIRHLLLPGLLSESKRIIDWIGSNFPNEIYLSLMCQYVPMYKAEKFPEINKRVSPITYEWLIDYVLQIGLENGFIQEYDSAQVIYTPDFNLDGI
jgi:putative pyruvate formate lyase activating enzyme